jgi:hypothetical protein
LIIDFAIISSYLAKKDYPEEWLALQSGRVASTSYDLSPILSETSKEPDNIIDLGRSFDYSTEKGDLILPVRKLSHD